MSRHLPGSHTRGPKAKLAGSAPKVFVALVAFALAFVVAAPASADSGGWESVGPKLAFFNPPSTFSANTPFHIELGLGCAFPAVSPCVNAGTYVDLFVDGVLQPSRVDIDNLVFQGIHALFRRDTSAFPNGLPVGTHTFEADFYFDGAFFTSQTDVIVFQ
jgi:hypothetical protein